MDRTVPKAHPCRSLAFPPTTCAIPSPQSPQLSDRPADRDGFDGADLANDLEVHCANLACGLNDLDVTPLPNAPLSGRDASNASPRTAALRSWPASTLRHPRDIIRQLPGLAREATAFALEVAAQSLAGLCRASERGGDAYRLIEEEHGESSHRLGAAEVMCYATLHLGILEKRNDLLL